MDVQGQNLAINGVIADFGSETRPARPNKRRSVCRNGGMLREAGACRTRSGFGDEVSGDSTGGNDRATRQEGPLRGSE
jgi:hypothetical protein